SGRRSCAGPWRRPRSLSAPWSTAQAAGGTPEGRWTTIDDHTGEVRSIVHIRIENDELRGRIEKVLPRGGEDPDPECGRCPDARRGATWRRDGNPGRVSPGREPMDGRPRTRSRERQGV